MSKKFLLACALSSMMLASPIGVTSASAINPSEDTVQLANGQIEVPANDVESAPVNTIRESKTAQKMTQAEKMQNAQENDEYGGGITIIAMSIVIFALAVLSILFLIFGKISSKLIAHKKRKSAPVAHAESETSVDSGEVIAAISMALAEHIDGKGHDLERTIMTLRRMKRNYSPWNSKIYNIRQIPEIHK